MNKNIKKVLSRISLITFTLLLLICGNTKAQFSVDLSTHSSGTPPPSGSVLEWHNALPIGSANLMTNSEVSAAPAGNYYAVYYDAVGNCYSPYSKITVAANTCPSNTVDLSSHVNTAPSGSSVVWYTNATHTGTAYSTPTTASAGTYYAFYYDVINSCFSPASSPIVVTIGSCTAVQVSNVCPVATVDLSTHVSTAPSGSTVVWYTNATHTGTAYSSPTTAGAGTYYAFFYDAANNCYSPSSLPIMVTINTCNAVQVSNVCPATTVDLSLHVNTAPNGSTVVWYTNNTHTGTAYSTPTTAGAGTYYAFFYDATNNCYSPASTGVQVTINNCSSTNPDINVTLINVPVTGNVSTNDDVPVGTTYGTPISVSGNPSSCTPTMSSTGAYTFVCNTPGEYNYLVPVCPPGQSTNCPTELLTITVEDPSVVTEAPTVNPDITTTLQNIPVTLNVLSNDECNNGTGCTLTNPSITDQPNNGTVTVNANGTVTYTPNPTFVGTDTLQYASCDNQSPAKCDTAYVIVTVLPVGAPNSTTANDDYKSGGMGIPLTGNLLSNDTDPEGNLQTAITQNLVVPGKGTFTLNSNGSFVFVPVDSFKGPISFPYTVCDNGTPQACANATLYILIEQPDITPNITATPNIMHGTTSFNVTVRVTELNMAKTNGLITVRIPKDTRMSFIYNPTATAIGFTPVSNTAWIYNGSNPFFHIFTTNNVIAKGGFLTFGFNATFVPGNTQGNYTMTSTILSGSGSENRTNNNTDSEALDYFHN